MTYLIIFLLTVVAFFLGFLIALHFVSENKVEPDEMEMEIEDIGLEKADNSSSQEIVNEEKTRKVNRVEIEDLLHLDGDVIEAEPAPTVPRAHFDRVSQELKILKQEIKTIKEKTQKENRDSVETN